MDSDQLDLFLEIAPVGFRFHELKAPILGFDLFGDHLSFETLPLRVVAVITEVVGAKLSFRQVQPVKSAPSG